MAHHKRGKPKNVRAGCLLCKPHKCNKGKNRKGYKSREQLRADRQLKEEMRRLH